MTISRPNSLIARLALAVLMFGLLALATAAPVHGAAVSVSEPASAQAHRLEPGHRLLPIQGPGVSPLVETDNLRAQLIAGSDTVHPGAQVDLALVFEIRPNWHTYWKNPGDSGEPPRLSWQLPEGVSLGPMQWTYPSLIRVGPLANYGYSRQVVHLLALSVPPDWPPGEPIEVAADATWLVCEEHCIPEQGTFSLRLQTATSVPQAATNTRASLFSAARAKLPIGGVIAARLERGGAAAAEPVDDTGNRPDASANLDPALDAEPGGERMHLSVPAAALPPELDSVVFFADEWGLIEHAAPQTWRIDDDRLVMSLVPGAAPHSAAPSGLLVVETPTTPRRDANPAGLADTGDVVKLSFAIDASGRSAVVDEIAKVPGSVPAEHVGGSVPRSEAIAAAEGGPIGLPLALAFALLGGLILNLMPCVFPVLAIKALSLAQQGQQPLAARLAHGMAYTAGVLIFFALAALVLLTLRAGGAAIGWGFQLQAPTFVVLMAYLFLALGLSLSGAITLGTGLMGIGARGPSHGHLGAFITGALAALVAAPCTAPFMGAALGFALAQPWPAALAVVLALGLGMALPFLLLALSPALARRLPRPGAWMETLKQLLAFPMYATAAWLLWVLSVQTGPVGIGAGLAGVVLLALGLWLLEAARAGQGRWQRLAQVSAAVSLALALWLGIDLAPDSPGSMDALDQSAHQSAQDSIPKALDASRDASVSQPLDPGQAGLGLMANAPQLPEPIDGASASDGVGEDRAGPDSDATAAARGSSSGVARRRQSGPAAIAYSPAQLDAARAAGRPVFVNMTAAWCITCLVNERVALSRPAVIAAFAERDLVYLKGDWTNRDAQITAYLASFGRSGVPLYVYYPPGAEPRVLPQVLTESIVLDSL